MKKKKDTRDDLLSLIPPDAKRILDAGCGNGNVGVRIQACDVEVIGIEKDNALCDQAKGRLAKVHRADIEQFTLPYPREYFDCILLADILEHLREPLIILRQLRSYLKNSGCIVASIPNIRYYKVIIKLVTQGTWDYAESGILDKGHLRFFTLSTMKELFTQAGYEVSQIRRNVIGSRAFKALNLLLCYKLKDFLAYQYYIKAVKTDTQPKEASSKIKQNKPI